jgi:hypothetical protein
MTQPTYAPEGQIWIGDKNADSGEPGSGTGWYTIVGQVGDQQLGQFQARIIQGDPTADSDTFVSSLVFANFTGGGQIKDLNFASDMGRFYWGILDTRVVNQITLPPLVRRVKPDGVGDTIVRPLGDVGTHTYIAFGTDAYAFDAGTMEFLAVNNALGGTPVRKGVEFKGRLYVPFGASGYCYLTESNPTTGALTVTAGAASPDPVDFCVIGMKLWALATDGTLWWSVDGAAWTHQSAADDPAVFIGVDSSHTPRGLASFWDKNGVECLHVITNKALWIYYDQARSIEKTALKWAPHPYFGRGWAEWHAGEDLCISAGDDIVKFAGGTSVVPASGLRRDAGLPPTHRGHIVDLQAEMSALYALIQGSIEDTVETTGLLSGDMTDWGLGVTYFDVQAAQSSLCLQSGSGWHAYWEADDPFMQVTWMVLGAVDEDNYALWWGGNDGYAYRLTQYTDFHNPLIGILSERGEFGTDGYVYTGRFDAAMLGFDKVALHSYIHWEHLPDDTSIELWYRTDRDEEWRLLGEADPDDRSTVLEFDVDSDGFAWGERFNWIEFWLKFNRDVSTSVFSSPALRAMTFHYTKRPQNATAVSVVIEQDEYLHGVHASVGYEYLKGLVEADTMVKVVVGNRIYRTRVTGVEKMGYSGMDETGQVKVNFIDLRPVEL